MTICHQLLRSAVNVFNSLRVILAAFPVNRLASAITTVCNVFLCPCSVHLVRVYRAQEPMIKDSGFIWHSGYVNRNT